MAGVFGSSRLDTIDPGLLEAVLADPLLLQVILLLLWLVLLQAVDPRVLQAVLVGAARAVAAFPDSGSQHTLARQTLGPPPGFLAPPPELPVFPARLPQVCVFSPLINHCISLLSNHSYPGHPGIELQERFPSIRRGFGPAEPSLPSSPGGGGAGPRPFPETPQTWLPEAGRAQLWWSFTSILGSPGVVWWNQWGVWWNY